MTSNTRKPQWWQLYVGLPVLVGLFLPETKVVLTETGHIVAELGILALIFGFVRMWLRANRSALMWVDEEQGRWRVNIYEFPARQLQDLEELEARPAARSMLRVVAPETRIAGSPSFEWGARENQASQFADQSAIARKE